MRLEKKIESAREQKAAIIERLEKHVAEQEEAAADVAAYEAWQSDFDALEGELKSAADELNELEARREEMAARAKRVDEMLAEQKELPVEDKEVSPVNKMAAPAIAKGKAKKLYEGDLVVRRLMAEYQAQKGYSNVVDVAKSIFPNDPRVADSFVMRAPVAVPTTGDPNVDTLAPVVDAQNEFIDLLRNQVVYSRIPGMRQVPIENGRSVRIPRTASAVAAQWVGEGNSIPVEAPTFDSITIDPYKLGVICLSTEELMMRSDPAYERILRDQMVEAVAQAVDTTFISDTAAVAGVSPAGVLDGIAANAITMPAIPTAQQAIDCIEGLKLAMMQNNIMGPFVWVLSTRTVSKLRSLRSAIDTPLFPELTSGQLQGYPVIESNNVPTNLLGGGEAPMILMKGAEMYFGMGNGVDIAISREAYIQSDNAPATPPTGGVSLYQQQMVALRITMMTSWARRRDEAVSWTTSLA